MLTKGRLAAEEAADDESEICEVTEAENLRKESEAFLARQMDELHTLVEERRNAGMLLDDSSLELMYVVVVSFLRIESRR